MPPVQPRPTAVARGGAARRRSSTDVVDTALDLLDRAGLPALSMRRIAQELGVQPSALYWHFTDKQSLLAALSLRVLDPSAVSDVPAGPSPSPECHPRPEGPTAQAGAPSSMSWEDAVRTAAAHLRNALLAHRDGAELVSSSLALGLVELPLAARLRSPLAAAGASGRTRAVVAETLGHFVIGHTFHEQQRAAAAEACVLPGELPGTTSNGDSTGGTDDSGASAPGAGMTGADMTGVGSFAAGVDLVVAGTAVLISLDRTPSPGPGID